MCRSIPTVSPTSAASRPFSGGDGTVLPHLVFANSMSDAWHEKIPTEFIHKVLDVMEAKPGRTIIPDAD